MKIIRLKRGKPIERGLTAPSLNLPPPFKQEYSAKLLPVFEKGTEGDSFYYQPNASRTLYLNRLITAL
jgi:hypothetical protein